MKHRAARTGNCIGVLSALGRIDEAVERLERAVEARIGAVVFVRHNIWWADLRGDPRMDRILSAVGPVATTNPAPDRAPQESDRRVAGVPSAVKRAIVGCVHHEPAR